jgi:hypothetical protein
VRINLKTGRGSLRAACTNVAGDLCRFNLTMRVLSSGSAVSRKKAAVVGRVKGTVAGGKRGALTVKLTSKGIRRLRHAHRRKLAVALAGSSKNRQGQATKLSSRKLALAASGKR